jgi:enamine deaminase RidA (YjgF/YER057c/UK114 family)
MNSDRRSFLGKSVALTAVAGAATVTKASAQDKPVKKVIYHDGKKPDKTPMFSGTVQYGNLLFLAGVGAHFQGDITAHTAHVLEEIQKQLEAAGSSMAKVLKCTVYLAKGEDFQAMNAVFLGKFGPEPPVRTTIAAAWIPGDSLIEIDVIAAV